MDTHFRNYIRLLDENLSGHENVKHLVGELIRLPEILYIYVGELNSALSLLTSFCYTSESGIEDNVYINASYLRLILRRTQLELPSWEELVISLSQNTNEIQTTFQEMRHFEFIDEMSVISQLAAALFVGFYRTYVLVSRPSLRKANVQVASSIEEMLAKLAIDGYKTHLFSATKHWILDYENEGFSKILAAKIANM